MAATNWRTRAVLLLALPAFLTGWVWLAAPTPALADRAHEAQMREIARGLACPVCQGLSVNDSPSPLATQMRAIILERLEAGESREQVVQYFVARYGESILFEPPRQGFGLLIWWVPVLGVLAGAATLGLWLARCARPREPSSGAAPPPVPPDALAAYLPRLEAELALREGLPRAPGGAA